MATFPSFGLTLEEKSSMQVDIDALLADAQKTFTQSPFPTVRDYSAALSILNEATTLAKDLRQYEDEEDEEEDVDVDVDGCSSPSSFPSFMRRRAVNQSLANASLLRGDILRALDKIPEARDAYHEAIKQCPDDYPPSDAHAALTYSSSSSSYLSSPRHLRRRPSSLPASPSSAAAAAAAPHHTAARAWKALLELAHHEDQQQQQQQYVPTTAVGAGGGGGVTAHNTKRRAGVWSAGYYDGVVAPGGMTRAAQSDRDVAQLLWDPEPAVAIRDVGARQRVRIVERRSSFPTASAVEFDRSIHHKRKCGDLRMLRAEAQGKW